MKTDDDDNDYDDDANNDNCSPDDTEAALAVRGKSTETEAELTADVGQHKRKMIHCVTATFTTQSNSLTMKLSRNLPPKINKLQNRKQKQRGILYRSSKSLACKSALILFIQTLALYKSFTYLLT